MVEQEAVNFEVAGSSPAVGAKEKASGIYTWGFFYSLDDLCSRQRPRELVSRLVAVR